MRSCQVEVGEELRGKAAWRACLQTSWVVEQWGPIRRAAVGRRAQGRVRGPGARGALRRRGLSWLVPGYSGVTVSQPVEKIPFY